MTEHIDFKALLARIGQAHLEQRLLRQAGHVADLFGPGLLHFHIENMHWTHWLIRVGLRAVGMYRRGQRNALAPAVRHNLVALPNLPADFHGFRLLQLSDLHCDINTGIVTSLIERIRDEPYDVCVLTGDYRSRTFGSFELTLTEMARLRAAIHGPVYAVLGNHDFIEMVAPLEAMGIRVLLNESVLIERGASAICLAGVDDAHYYEVDDLAQAARNLRPDIPGILLSHTPEIYSQAAASGFQLMLSGHTHGGQICLPGGFPLLLNARCPRSLCMGAWRYKTLQGYTSRGVGVSGVDVRFNSPGEIVIHQISG